MQKTLNIIPPNLIGRVTTALKIGFVLVLLVGLAGVAVPKTAKADVILPGQKSVDYCFSISNLNAFPDYVIIEAHYRGGPEVVNGACKEEYNDFAGLYATKRAGFEATQLPSNANKEFFAGNSAFLPANTDIYPAIRADKDSPVVKIQDVLKIANITSTGLQLEKTSVIYTYSDGTSEEVPYRDQNSRPDPTRSASGTIAGISPWWYLLVPAVALVAVAFIVIRNNRKTPKRVLR